MAYHILNREWNMKRRIELGYGGLIFGLLDDLDWAIPISEPTVYCGVSPV